MTLRALIAAAVASVVSTQNVKVQFYAESGCPFCRDFIANSLKNTMAAEGVAAIIDFEYYPWGNAYFVTSKCGGAGTYDRTARACFNTQCGRDATSRADDCFTGELVCQHGQAECLGNRVLNCAKRASGADASKLVPFTVCLEAQYDVTQVGDDWWKSLANSCAGPAGIDASQIQSCYDGADGDAAVIDSAQNTPEHPGVPYVVVNGQPLDDTTQLLQAVCGAYTGTKPAGCGALVASAPRTYFI